MSDRQGSIFYFLFLASFIGGVIAAIIRFIFASNDSLQVVAFTLVVFGTALIYTYKMGSLKGKAVDFLYYFLAMVAAVLFFSHDTIQRQKVKSYDEYQQLLDEETDLKRKLTVLRFITSNSDTAYKTATKKARYEAEFAASVAKSFCRGVNIIGPMGRRTQTEKQILDRQSCTDAQITMQQWSDLAKKLESYNLESSDISKIPGLGSTVEIGGTKIFFKFVLQLLIEASQTQDSIKLKEKEDELNFRLQKAKNEIKVLESKHITPRSMDELKPDLIDRAVLFLWPYVLVLMLGLKLARTDYLGDIKKLIYKA